MNALQTTTASLTRQWRGWPIRALVGITGAIAVGIAGGRLGYFTFQEALLALSRTALWLAWFSVIAVPGMGDFCLAGIYAALFGLLTRRGSGRLTGAVVAWLAMACAGVVIAGAVEPTDDVVHSAICAGAIGGLVGGAPIALYASRLQLFETRGRNSGPSQFSMVALLWIVLGFAVLFGGLRLYSEYER